MRLTDYSGHKLLQGIYVIYIKTHDAVFTAVLSGSPARTLFLRRALF